MTFHNASLKLKIVVLTVVISIIGLVLWYFGQDILDYVLGLILGFVTVLFLGSQVNKKEKNKLILSFYSTPTWIRLFLILSLITEVNVVLTPEIITSIYILIGYLTLSAVFYKPNWKNLIKQPKKSKIGVLEMVLMASISTYIISQLVGGALSDIVGVPLVLSYIIILASSVVFIFVRKSYWRFLPLIIFGILTTLIVVGALILYT